jgi:hypothetical protein
MQSFLTQTQKVIKLQSLKIQKRLNFLLKCFQLSNLQKLFNFF